VSSPAAPRDKHGEDAERRRIVSLYLGGLLILLLAGWTLFSRLDAGSLNDWDEATYGQIAREMVSRGDWLTPHWNGLPFHDKPPLVFWLMAVGLLLTDSAELAIRFPSALAGFGVIVMTAWLGRSMFCTWTGLTAATLLLIGNDAWWINFVQMAKQGMLDVPLTGFTVWALLHFWIGLRDPRQWRWIGLPLGLAVMTKSLLAGPIVLIILASALAVAPTGRRLSRAHYAAAATAVAVAGGIALPWHLLEVLRHGSEFIEGYLLVHFMKTVHVEGSNAGDWMFYSKNLAQATPLWPWLGIPALGLAMWHALWLRSLHAWVILFWVGIPVVIFSLIPTKLPWYVLPVLPGLVLLMAWFIRTVTPHNWLPESVVLAALILCVVFWNEGKLTPADTNRDTKRLGACVTRSTPADETVAFFDPRMEYCDTRLRPAWNIRPGVRFYANRSMINIPDESALEQWALSGGRFAWPEQPIIEGVSDRFRVVGRFGDQLLLRYVQEGSAEGDSIAGIPAACR
jgi:4-amino-4-deoxy-L-arabinose transferase-like glycosyltransferase